MGTALADRPASSRARVSQQRCGVLFLQELQQSRIEDVLDQPAVIAALDRRLDFGGAHRERELGLWLVGHAVPSPERSGTTLSAGGLTIRSISAANFS